MNVLHHGRPGISAAPRSSSPAGGSRRPGPRLRILTLREDGSRQPPDWRGQGVCWPGSDRSRSPATSSRGSIPATGARSRRFATTSGSCTTSHARPRSQRSGSRRGRGALGTGIHETLSRGTLQPPERAPGARARTPRGPGSADRGRRSTASAPGTAPRAFPREFRPAAPRTASRAPASPLQLDELLTERAGVLAELPVLALRGCRRRRSARSASVVSVSAGSSGTESASWAPRSPSMMSNSSRCALDTAGSQTASSLCQRRVTKPRVDVLERLRLELASSRRRLHPGNRGASWHHVAGSARISSYVVTSDGSPESAVRQDRK